MKPIYCPICQEPTYRTDSGTCIQCFVWEQAHKSYPIPTREQIIASYDETEYVAPILEAEFV